jgi:hypothetical protein
MHVYAIHGLAPWGPERATVDIQKGGVAHRSQTTESVQLFVDRLRFRSLAHCGAVTPTRLAGKVLYNTDLRLQMARDRSTC